MAVRSAMTDLIARLRRLSGDTVAPNVFSDQDLQDTLDSYRESVHAEILEMQPTLGSPIQYLDYYADRGDWESDVVLKDSNFVTISAATSEPIAGRWAFTTEPAYPVYLTGRTYDLSGAAAEILEEWATRLKLEYDFSSNDQRFARSQRIQALLDLAERCRQRARPRCGAQVRGDVPGIEPDIALSVLRR